MRMNRDLFPELCASKDETRFHLCTLHLDVEGKCIVATDGHKLVTVPVIPDEGDHTGAITIDALKHARKLARAAGKSCTELQIKANGAQVCADGTTFKRPDVQFPPYRQVVPTFKRGDEGTITICFSAAYLAEIAKSLDGGNSPVEVTMMRGDDLAPLVVKVSNGEGHAVLMPCRMK